MTELWMVWSRCNNACNVLSSSGPLDDPFEPRQLVQARTVNCSELKMFLYRNFLAVVHTHVPCYIVYSPLRIDDTTVSRQNVWCQNRDRRGPQLSGLIRSSPSISLICRWGQQLWEHLGESVAHIQRHETDPLGWFQLKRLGDQARRGHEYRALFPVGLLGGVQDEPLIVLLV